MNKSNDVDENLKKFKIDKILINDIMTKKVIVLGTIGDEKSILILEKGVYFKEEMEENSTINGILELNKEFVNDIYCNFTVKFDWGNRMKGISIYPATEEIILKYSPKEKIQYIESYSDYKTKLEPYIKGQIERKNKVIFVL